MRSRLKEAYYRWKLGPEQAELLNRMERKVADLRPCDAWVKWFWALPPEAWEEAVQVGRLEIEIVAARESTVRAITRRNKWRLSSPDSPQALAAEKAAAQIKKVVLDQEATLREGRFRLTARVGKVPCLRGSSFPDQEGKRS